MMVGAEVLRVLDVLEAVGVRAGISGGWGIDALLRRETRAHGDLDLGVDAPDLQVAFHAHYEPRDHDRRDMDALASAFELSLPPAYRDLGPR